MFRILLADDDILALNRLLGLIDWNSHGYEIVGQALGGKDCLKLLDSLHPDILLLDIDMPDLNGVEVTRQVQKRNLPTKILILSNYDTFHFVRDALHYGAYDYLLKHQITGPILLTKLSELSRLMEKEGLVNTRRSFFATVAKRNYLHSLITNGTISPEEHSHMLTQKDFSDTNFCMAVMQISNFILITHFSPNMDREKMIDSVMTLAANIFSSLHNGLITSLEYGQFAVLFHYGDQASTKAILEHVSGAMRLLCANIHKILGLTCLYQVSDVFSDIQKLPDVFLRTRQVLEQQPFPSSDADTRSHLRISEEKELMNALVALDSSRTRQLLQEIFARCEQSGGISQPLIQSLLMIGTRFQQSQGMEPIKGTDIAADLAHMTSQEVCLFLTDYFNQIMKNSPGQGSRRYSPHVQKVLLYIHENYASDLSLSAVAELFHVSHTHLSRLFSKEVGTSFTDYLVSYRIERARQLIANSDQDLKTIGETVGFHSYNYFLRAYKEKTGRTPSQDMRPWKN